MEWDNTEALVPYGSLYACLFINSDSKSEIDSILTDISNRLYKVKDPDTGEKIIRKIWRPDKVMDNAPFLDGDLPDAIIEPSPGYSFNSSMSREKLFSIPSFKMGALGRHEREGIVILSPSIASLLPEKWKGEIYIGNLAPLILTYLGIEPPFYMDIEGKSSTD